MIKKITTIILILFTNFSSFSQNKLEFVKIGNNSFIKPTTEALIMFLNQSMSDWENLMQQNGYRLLSDSDSTVIYIKGKIGYQTQAIAKNKRGIVSIIWYDFIDKIKTLTKFETSIKNYYFKKANDIKFYIYEEYIIGIKSDENEYCVNEEIHIKHK